MANGLVLAPLLANGVSSVTPPCRRFAFIADTTDVLERRAKRARLTSAAVGDDARRERLGTAVSRMSAAR